MGAGPQATVMLLHPSVAAAMKRALEGYTGSSMQTWEISDEQTLVAYADLVDDWNAIASVSTVGVREKAEQLPWMVPCGRGFAVGRLTLLGVATFVGTLAARVVLESMPVGKPKLPSSLRLLLENLCSTLISRRYNPVVILWKHVSLSSRNPSPVAVRAYLRNTNGSPPAPVWPQTSRGIPRADARYVPGRGAPCGLG